MQPTHELAEAFDAGRRAGLAVAALALGCVAFLSLLGMEKAGLAIILGIVALRGGKAGLATRRLALAAIGLGALFILTVIILLVVYWERVRQLITELQKLS
jgi:hypothetical protein